MPPGIVKFRVHLEKFIVPKLMENMAPLHVHASIKEEVCSGEIDLVLIPHKHAVLGCLIPVGISSGDPSYELAAL